MAVDYQLLLLLAMIAVVLFVGIRTDRRAWPGRPGSEYQWVFSAAAAGLLFFVSGLIGWDLSDSRGWFQGTKWTDAPIWWQAGLGAGLLLLAGIWARRLWTRQATERP